MPDTAVHAEIPHLSPGLGTCIRTVGYVCRVTVYTRLIIKLADKTSSLHEAVIFTPQSPNVRQVLHPPCCCRNCAKKNIRMMTPQGSGGRRRNRKKGKNRATAGGELNSNQHVAATSASASTPATAAGPSTSTSTSTPASALSNPIPVQNLRSTSCSPYGFPTGPDTLLVSTLTARVRSFLDSLYRDSPCAYSRIFTKYLQPSLEAHLRNHFFSLESDDLWEQILGWRTPESAPAMVTSSGLPRFKLPHASLFGPSRTDYSQSPGPQGWNSPWPQPDHSGVASTWAAIGVEIWVDGTPVHPDYAENPWPAENPWAAESSWDTPGAGEMPTSSTSITRGGLIQPVPERDWPVPTHVQARPSPAAHAGVSSSSASRAQSGPGTSGADPGNSRGFQVIEPNAAAAAGRPSSYASMLNLRSYAAAGGYRRRPRSPGLHTQNPTSPMSTAQPRSPTSPYRSRPSVANEDYLTAGHDSWGWQVTGTISAEQTPAQALVSSHRAPAPAPRIPTPPMPRSRSSSASPSPNPYALAEEASVLLEVFCQSLNEDAASADLTQNRDLIKGARDNVNEIWDTLWGGEGKGLAGPSHDYQDPSLMVYSGCVICYSSVAETVLLPCNHLVLCLVRLLCRTEWIGLLLFYGCQTLIIFGFLGML